MIYSNQINEKTFNLLIECIKKKGTIIADLKKSTTSNLFTLTINGKLHRYINYFEAFNNLYTVYNCQKNIKQFFSKTNEKETKKDEEIFYKDGDAFYPEEKNMLHHLELELYKDKEFIRLTEIEREGIIFQIKTSNLSTNSKEKIINKLIENLDNIYIREIESKTGMSKIKFNNHYERIIMFLKSYLKKV